MRSQPSRSTEPLPGGNPSRPLSRRLALLGAWLIALVGLAGPAMAQIANAEWELGLLPAPAQVPQTAPANSAFGLPLSVLVTDRFDNPLAGQLVGYTANGATANAALTMPALTGADGRSSASATANSQLGSYTVTAVLGTGVQNTATFNLTNTLATAANLSVTAPMPATATIQTSYADGIVATVTDGGGQPVQGVSVTFAAPVSGASATFAGSASQVVVTDASGIATSAAPTANATAGSFDVTVTVSGVAPELVGLSNLSGAAVSLVAVSGDDQSTTINSAFAQPLVVELRDGGGNVLPIAPGSVSFTAPASGASASLAPATGEGTTTATANGQVGSYVVTATWTDGVDTHSALFSLSNVADNGADASLILAGPALAAATQPAGAWITGFQSEVGNAGSTTAQPVHTRLIVVRIDDGNNDPITGSTGTPGGDIDACVSIGDGLQGACDAGYFSLQNGKTVGTHEGRAAVFFRYPNQAINDQPLPATGGLTIPVPTAFKFAPGEYRLIAELVGSDNGQVYASSNVLITTVPDAGVAVAGVVTGAAGESLPSSVQVTNGGGRVPDNVMVRLTLSDVGVVSDYPNLVQVSPTVYTFSPSGSSFSLVDGYDSLFTGRVQFDAPGTYTVTADVLDAVDPGLVWASATHEITIDQQDVTITLSDLNHVYNGSSKSVTASTSPADVALVVTYEGIDVSYGPTTAAPTNAGSYTVTAVPQSASYSGSASNTLTITKAVGTVDFAPLSGAYGTVHAVTASLAQSDSNVSCMAVSGVPAQSAPAGSYPISASCSSDNYTASGSAVYEVTAVDVVFTLDGATVGVAGSDPEIWSYFTATTANPNGITLGEQLVVDIAIERGGGIAAGDVVLEVEPWGAPGTWVDIPLAMEGDVLTGTFGPYSLDPVSSEANLRARVARGGRYNVVATAAGVSSDATYASATHAVDVAQLGLSGSGNINGVVGTAVEGAYSLVNSGTADLGTHMPAPNDENVRGRFFIEGPVALTGASVPGCGNEACTSPDVAVEFFNPLTNAYQRIYNLRAELDEFNVPTGRLFGHFGALASGGQPVPAGATGTFLFRTTFLQHTGTYTVTSQVVGIDSGKVYAEAVPQTIGIGTGTAATIELVGGDAGEAVVGGNSYDNGDLVVRVLDAGGNPVAGAAVAYNVHAGGNGAGASFAAPDLTDSNGETAITALSNAVAGDFTVTASIGIGIDQSVEFVLRNVADDASQLHLVSGSGQTASLNQPFALPLVVRVTDQYGNPVAGELVDFLAPATRASADLSIPADPTDTNGETFVLALANGLPGSYVAEAGTGYGSVDFGLTNTAATADMLALAVVGSDEAVVASGSYTLQATVTGSGNAVPGVSVTFVVEPGSNGAGATTSNAVAITDINGVATATFNANTVAGGFVVRAVVSGVLPDADDVAMLTNLADAATTLAMVSGSPQSAAVNSAFAQPLMVRASDIHGNPIAGAVVDFAANGATANATLDPADGTVVTGVDGTAAVTAEANGIAGSYSVTALAAFGSPVDFALENTVGSVTISDIVWADSNAATVAYDGNAKAATATVAGSSATPVFTYNGHASAPVDAGTYLVTATVDDGNVFGSASAMLTIEPAAAGNTGIDLTGGSFVYDGTAKPATVTNPDGVAYALAYDTGNGLAPVNAGSYTATLTVTDPNHAADTLTAMIEISPAPVELVFGNLEHVYDGSAKAATVTTVPAGVTGVSLDYSQGGSPATPVDAGSYEVEATLANPNHVLTGTTTAELVIDKATAQVFLSNLTQVYDGTQKVVTVTTVPAALAADVEVSYTPAVPVNVGSYAVEALLEGHPNYEDVSANATLSIIAATIAGFEIIGDDSFSGVAGEALTGALPTVRVYDTSGLGVPGISVEFAVTAGAGSIEGAASAAVTTGADGQATVPEWVLGAVAGANTMTAATGMAGLQELEFSATGEQVAQLSIDKSVNLTQAHAGQVLDYSIVVANDGPSTVQATLLDAIPDGLEDISWICLAEDGALCGEASGNGDIDFDSTIPAGGSITVTISATVAADATTGQAMVNTAVVTWLSEGEEQEAEASASTNIVPAYSGPCSIFCDGFEDIDLGKRLALPEAADAAAVHGWDLVSGQSGRPQLAVELVDGAGQAVAWLDSLKIGEQSMVRLRSLDDQGKQRAGTWQAWPAGASVNYGWELDFDGLRLDFVPAGAAKAGLHLRLPAGAAIPERARSHAATAH